MPRIRWVEESEATGDLASLYDEVRTWSPVGQVPDIMKTMSVRPELLRAIFDASGLHFSDGFLSRAEHEMIASYVSALNKCHY